MYSFVAPVKVSMQGVTVWEVSIHVCQCSFVSLVLPTEFHLEIVSSLLVDTTTTTLFHLLSCTDFYLTLWANWKSLSWLWQDIDNDLEDDEDEGGDDDAYDDEEYPVSIPSHIPST